MTTCNTTDPSQLSPTDKQASTGLVTPPLPSKRSAEEMRHPYHGTIAPSRPYSPNPSFSIPRVGIIFNCHRKFFWQDRGLGAFRSMPQGWGRWALPTACCSACKTP